MKNSELLKKCVINFVISVFALISVASIVAVAMLLVKDAQSQHQIRYLVEQQAFNKKQIAALTTALSETRQQVVAAKAETAAIKTEATVTKVQLNNALVPQATVSEAFYVNVSEPVSRTATEVWKNVSESSRKAWNYVFE
jgi:hypothetical protein